MANKFINIILDKLQNDFGVLKKFGNSLSLFEIQSINILIYFRYSKITRNGNLIKAFYGLREEDLKLLQGRNSFICYVSDEEKSTFLMPFSDYEQYFYEYAPSTDGQYKVLIFFKKTGTELYISKVGKFNIDAYNGLSKIYEINQVDIKIPEFSHSQMQSLICAIGYEKGFDIWVPQKDRIDLDSNFIKINKIRNNLPSVHKYVDRIIEEIDILWLDKNNTISSLFEVEHSTPIYSGLLRMNDANLAVSNIKGFKIVAPSDKRNKFILEINRPTFKYFKLDEKITFLDYESAYRWYNNIIRSKNEKL